MIIVVELETIYIATLENKMKLWEVKEDDQ